MDKKNIFKNTYFILLLIALFGLAFRLAFFSGMGISDSLVYSKTANDFNLGKGIDTESTLTLSTRLGLIYTTSASYKILGINDFSSVLFPLLTSIAGIIIIFYFGKLLFNEKTGLMASFLLSIFPLDVVYSTQLLSDLPSAFFMSLGVYIFLYAELKKQLKYGLSYLFSGILIGISYLIRESALLIALFFIAYIIYKRKIKKEYFLVILGVLLVFALESLIFFNLTNDALFRIHASQQYLKEAAASHNYFGRLDFPTGLFHYPWLFLANPLLSLFYVPIFISTAYIFVYKKKEGVIILLWLIPLLVYLSFGSSSFTEYIPFRAVDRYTSIFTFPAIIIMAVFLSENDRRLNKAMVPAALIILLLLSVSSVHIRGGRNLLGGLRDMSPFVENLKKPAYVDERSLKVLDYISGYKINPDINPYPEDFKGIRDSYVIINKEMIKSLIEANNNIKFPDEIKNPPAEWELAADKPKDGIKAYHIP